MNIFSRFHFRLKEDIQTVFHKYPAAKHRILKYREDDTDAL